MKHLTSKTWWKAAGMRAIKMIAQVAVSMIGTSALLREINWSAVLSAAVLAGFLSLLYSILELPEEEHRQENP